jgi:hypothetical protein
MALLVKDSDDFTGHRLVIVKIRKASHWHSSSWPVDVLVTAVICLGSCWVLPGWWVAEDLSTAD